MTKGMIGGLGEEGGDRTEDICRGGTIGGAGALVGIWGGVQAGIVLEQREIMQPAVEDMRAKHSQTCSSCVLSSRSFPCTSSRDSGSALSNGLPGARRRGRGRGNRQGFSAFQQRTGVYVAEPQTSAA